MGERKLLGPELVQIINEKVKLIRERMKEAQDRKKSYVDNQRRPLEFMVGDQVFLKVPLVKILWRSSQIKKET